jgi:hypothetical protein
MTSTKTRPCAKSEFASFGARVFPNPFLCCGSMKTERAHQVLFLLLADRQTNGMASTNPGKFAFSGARASASFFMCPMHENEKKLILPFSPLIGRGIRPGPFQAGQKFLYKACADSFYFGCHDLSDVVKGCGGHCTWTINSLNHRCFVTDGSRFALDNRSLENHPISGRGHKLMSFNLKRTPNIELMRCRLNHLPAHQMVINLHWVGASRLRATAFFTHNEVAVINVVLNITRLVLVNGKGAPREAHLTEELSKLKLFETDVKGPTKGHVKTKTHHLSSTSMLLFAQQFMFTLEKLSKCSQIFFRENVSKHTAGMSFGEDIEEELGFNCMRSFSKSLFNNAFFVASLAGCKTAFHQVIELRHEFVKAEELNMAFLKAKVKETTAHIYKLLREQVFVIDGPRAENDGGIQCHLDLGIEISPMEDDNVSFLLHGPKTMACFKEFLGRRKTVVPFVRDENLIPTIFEDVPVFDGTDILLHEIGEVQPPHLARRIEHEGSDDDEASLSENEVSDDDEADDDQDGGCWHDGPCFFSV